MPEKSISELVLEYFKTHPNKDLTHGPVVDWVEKEYIKLGGTKPRDPWRTIRKLHQEGKLIKVSKLDFSNLKIRIVYRLKKLIEGVEKVDCRGVVCKCFKNLLNKAILPLFN